ncbi:putative cytochrome P450 [Lepidopterella palustris CBS 459.81]|uniref:Putative cytochrome P450 n=1 Tax=Lepidopterella palustris CBS 459.81 TaxID=1314670 RepID=A0A8E2E210_9PEZI|nr:putative cytochrome P450 [Lepidopterella palustris CBS 459.81]
MDTEQVGFLPWSAATAAAILSGVCLHLFYFKQAEHHMYGVRYLQAFFLVLLASISALTFRLQLPLKSSFSTTFFIAGNVLLGLWTSLLAYRFFFHPLRNFPGPFPARITSLWFSTQVIRSDAHVQLLKLHEQYGPFVRVGSSDLSIAHPLGVPAVHGIASRCRKASWYDEDYPRASIHTTRDHAWHHERRRIWSPAFSDKALRGYEKRIAAYNTALVDRIAGMVDRPVHVSQWFNYYSFDVMGELAFNKDFEMLSSGQQHWAIGLLNESMRLQGLKLPTWILRMLLAVPGLAQKYWKFIGYCDGQVEERIGKTVETPDVMSALLPKTESGSVSPQDLLTLRSDARTIIVAGSDTTAATLAHVFYELAKNPEHVAKLQDELSRLLDNGSEIEHRRIQHADHLNAGINVGDRYIPGGMHVWCPQYVLGRYESVYEQAVEFIPERWYARPEMIKEKAAYAPFSTGAYGCIGRPLALMQLRTVIASLVIKFDVEFAPGDDGSSFISNTKDQFTLCLADLNLLFKSRM